MCARMLRSPLWSTSLLLGLCLLTAACAASTSALAVTSPTLTPSPSPTATIAPTATAVAVANAACGSSSPFPFVNPPGPLLTTIPFPPGTLVAQRAMGIQAGSALAYLCTPGATPATITAFMNSALPAAGWMRQSVSACNAVQGYDWYKGTYGMDMVFKGFSPPMWALDFCPHVGQ
jgi:hypothetical protein